MRLNWSLICIDFSSAFVQSPLPKDEPVWMHVPRGYRCSQGSDYVLKLEKSLYGLCAAPKLWFAYAAKAFKELGLEQSKYDACLWFGKELVLVQYVDDCGIGAPNMKIIDKFVADLRQKGFKLTQEGSFTEFLGIKFDRLPDGSFELTQKGLITKILKATNMEDCNPNSLPAPQAAPTVKFTMDLYVDADFCRLFHREEDRDPNVARSRAGWIILLCGCPMIWRTFLMDHITQSTTEAEYSALTSALRTFLPLKLMVEEIIQRTGSTDLEGATVHATVFEDNQSAFYLATNQRITNRTRYFLAKWHWFWAAYNEKQFAIVKCPTHLMLADYFTKSLSRNSFERNRMGVQGW
jgi:hypothetical protein